MRLPFAKRPTHTLLWISTDLVARVDYVGHKSRLRIGQIELHKLNREKSVQESVALAIGLIPKSPGPVSVISPRFWTDILTLPTDVVSIAQGDELSQALALDAEIDSGVSAFESRTAFTQIESNENEDARFCVTQVSNTQLNEIAKSLRAMGTKLQFIAHPVAFELADQSESEEDTAESKLNSWKSDLAFHDRDDADCRQWLDSFSLGKLHQISSKTLQTPLLITPQANASPSRKKVASVALASFTIMGCVAWNSQARTDLKSITSEIAKSEQLQKQHVETSNSIKKATAKLVQLRKEASDTEQLVSNAEQLRQRTTDLQVQRSMRWSLLVDALAENAGECWVKRIVADGDRTIILGIAPSNAQAHEFAMRLESSLRGAGWTVSPAVSQLTTNGLYEFNIAVRITEANLDVKPDALPRSNQVVSRGSEAFVSKRASEALR